MNYTVIILPKFHSINVSLFCIYNSNRIYINRVSYQYLYDHNILTFTVLPRNMIVVLYLVIFFIIAGIKMVKINTKIAIRTCDFQFIG